MYLIYKHISPSGKAYIGQTKNLGKRTREHKSLRSECRAFSGAIQKYGFDSFTTEILATGLSLEEANILEEQFILEHNTLVPNGYNLKSGGLNQIPSQESIELMSVAKLGILNPNYGKVGAMLGKKHTLETSMKISAKKAGENHHMWGKVGTMLGRKHSELSLMKMKVPKSEQHKQKLSEGKRGEKNPNFGKKRTPESTQKRLATLAAKKAAKLANLTIESHETLSDTDV